MRQKGKVQHKKKLTRYVFHSLILSLCSPAYVYIFLCLFSFIKEVKEIIGLAFCAQLTSSYSAFKHTLSFFSFFLCFISGWQACYACKQA